MYEMKGEITFTQCDENGILKLHEAARLMTDCAQFQEYQETAFKEYLIKQNLAIYLFSLQIDFLRQIRFRDTVTTCVKIYGCKSIYGLRRFTIRNEQNELCAIANASGAFFDLKAGKAVKQDPEGFPVRFDPAEEMECLSRKVGLPPGTEGIPGKELIVGKSQLDPNGHLTSSEYFAITGNALDDSFTYTRVRMEYKRQAKCHEVIVPVVYQDGMTSVVDLRDKDDTFSYALAEFTSPVIREK